MTTPLDELRGWLQVDRSAPADSTTRPLMALATAAADGSPRVRHVLLSAYDADGLHFHSDSRSAKAAELAAAPRAAATIVWPDLPRQVTVSGPVTPEAPEVRAAFYRERSRYLQLLAWVNDAELAERDAAAREATWAAFDAANPVLSAPPTWAGWSLAPDRIAFWYAGGDAGPSQRRCCTLGSDGWTTERRPG